MLTASHSGSEDWECAEEFSGETEGTGLMMMVPVSVLDISTLIDPYPMWTLND